MIIKESKEMSAINIHPNAREAMEARHLLLTNYRPNWPFPSSNESN